jgi:hypothetical protein
MKHAIMTAIAMVLVAGPAFAGGIGSKKSSAPGVPGASLDPAACQSVWHMASPNGDTLSKEKSTPFVLNYAMVDTDKDGKVSPAEFQGGCSKGWIQKPDAATVDQMKGTKP